MIALAYVIGDGLFSPHVDPSLGKSFMELEEFTERQQ
jgi:hypothetical protein